MVWQQPAMVAKASGRVPRSCMPVDLVQKKEWTVPSIYCEVPTTSPRSLMLVAALNIVFFGFPSVPRYLGEPSLSQRTACKPVTFGGKPSVEQFPEDPTA